MIVHSLLKINDDICDKSFCQYRDRLIGIFSNWTGLFKIWYKQYFSTLDMDGKVTWTTDAPCIERYTLLSPDWLIHFMHYSHFKLLALFYVILSWWKKLYLNILVLEENIYQYCCVDLQKKVTQGKSLT